MYADTALERLDDLKREGSYRTFVTLNRHAGRYPMATVKRDDGMYEDVQVWCSNDYLAMSQHPTVIAAMQDTAARYGAGAGGSRNIGGTHRGGRSSRGGDHGLVPQRACPGLPDGLRLQ